MDSKGIRRHRACPLRCRRRLVGVSIYVFLLALGIASLKLLPWYHGNGQQPLASQIQHEEVPVQSLWYQNLQERAVDTSVREPLTISLNDTSNDGYVKSLRYQNLQKRAVDISVREPLKMSLNDTSYDGYVQIHMLPVFILSAIAVNTTEDSAWNKFVLSGWELHYMLNWTYRCCYYYQDDTIITAPFLKKHHFSDYVGYCNLEAKQFICSNPIQQTNVLPIGVTLTTSDTDCPASKSQYVAPAFPWKRPQNEFAVCSKVIYGNKTASDIVEWVEVQRLYGVSKIVLFPFLKDLNPAARSVLTYYETTGLMELIPFLTVPLNETFPRAFGYGWGFEMYNDEQVTLFDCQERLRGYTYTAMIDTDEFITPAENITYVQLMDKLYTNFPDASGFVFLDNMHVTSWGPTHKDSDMTITRYQNHTNPEYDTPKNIIRLDRMVPGSLHTHDHTPNEGYKKVFAPTELVVIHHYATCRDAWLTNRTDTPSKCFDGLRRIPGTTMSKIADMIRANVSKVKRKLRLV